MKKSRIWIAVAVLIGLSVAAVVTTRSHEAKSTIEKPTASLPTVKRDDVTSVEITKPGQPAIVLQKQPDGKSWKLTAPLEAEAGKEPVDAVLDRISDLDVTGIAATRKENHARLEVDPEHAIRVKAKGGQAVLADLHVGASKSGGTMVRVEGQDEVLAAEGSFRYVFDKEPKEFRNHEILTIEGTDLAALAISSPKGTFKFERGEATWAQAKGEKPIARFYPEKVHAVAGVLTSLRATDFAAPGEGDAVTGLNAPLAKATITKKDGSSVDVLLGKAHAEGDHYLRVSTSDVVYRVPKYVADELMLDEKALQKPEGKEGEQPAAGIPRVPGMPEGAMPELPPEIMEKLKASMQKSGQMPPGH